MAVATRAWIGYQRLRRRLRRGKPPEDWWPGRHAWVDEHARGRSFADIGGLFNIEGAVSFRAEDAGATRVTLMDAGDREFAFGFQAEHERRGSAVRYVQGDLHDPVTLAEVGRHDVVWCTGVLYHTPDPIDQLVKLRGICGEVLYLGTHTIPEVPWARNACVLYAGLDEASRRAHASAHGQAARGWGIGVPFDDTPMLGHGNFWWGITPSALRGMLAVARFEVVEERRPARWPWALDVVCRPVERDPVMPPVSYYRERREARARGEEPPPLEGYWEWRRAREGP